MPRFISAIVLAAGLSSRMAPRHKLLVEWEGQPVLRRVVKMALASAPHEVIVVTGHRQEDVARVISDLPVRTVHNAAYWEGMGSSLACGVRHVSPEAGGLLVYLGDMPLVKVDTARQLIAAFETEDDPIICVPVHQGRRGHPVLFHKAFASDLTSLTGDIGARGLMQGRSGQVRDIEVDDPGVLFDLDR